MKISLIFAAMLVATAVQAKEAKTPAPPNPNPIPVTTDCSADIPFGAPTVPGAIKVICKTGYVSYFDTLVKVPRFVGYSLTGDQTVGCLGRFRNFHTEKDLPGESRANENDYARTNFDLGHMTPFEDNATTVNRDYDSFSMANVAPQVPKMNREGWESLEQDVRDWAWMRGNLVVYVGSIFIGENTKTIGNGVGVPDRFYKIVVDPSTKEAIAFIMDNVPTPKGDMSSYVTTITEIEKQTGITFPLPTEIDKTVKSAMWPTDDKGWHQVHKQKCHTD